MMTIDDEMGANELHILTGTIFPAMRIIFGIFLDECAI